MLDALVDFETWLFDEGMPFAYWILLWALVGTVVGKYFKGRPGGGAVWAARLAPSVCS